MRLMSRRRLSIGQSIRAALRSAARARASTPVFVLAIEVAGLLLAFALALSIARRL